MVEENRIEKRKKRSQCQSEGRREDTGNSGQDAGWGRPCLKLPATTSKELSVSEQDLGYRNVVQMR